MRARPKMRVPVRPGPKVKTTRFRKRVKKTKVELISRKAQGLKWKMPSEVPKLERKVAFGGPVSSSWISNLEWTGTDAVMFLDNGYKYLCEIPFKEMQGWYYAPSKGTYFNERIKGKYKVRRIL